MRTRNIRPGLEHVLRRVPRKRTVTGSVAVGVAFTGPAHQVTGFMVLIPNESSAVFSTLVLTSASCAGK